MHPNLWALNLVKWMAWWIAELWSRKTLVTWKTGQQKPQVSVTESAKVLCLKQKTTMHGYSLGRDWLNRSPVEEQLGIMVGPKLNASQDWEQVKLHNKGRHPPVTFRKAQVGHEEFLLHQEGGTALQQAAQGDQWVSTLRLLPDLAG